MRHAITTSGVGVWVFMVGSGVGWVWVWVERLHGGDDPSDALRIDEKLGVAKPVDQVLHIVGELGLFGQRHYPHVALRRVDIAGDGSAFAVELDADRVDAEEAGGGQTTIVAGRVKN